MRKQAPPRTPDWRRLGREGLVLWGLLGAAFVALPSGHPLEVGLVLSGILAAPLVPAGLYFDLVARARDADLAPGEYLRQSGRNLRCAVNCRLPTTSDDPCTRCCEGAC